MTRKKAVSVAISVVLVAVVVAAQTAYQPKFKGDPARSESEAAALGYMRTLLRAQHIFRKRNGHYAETLMQLTKTGSFTRRMAGTDRGDYTVQFRPHKEKDTFDLTLLPKQEDSTHRSFFSDEEGKIRVDEQGEANETSAILKADSSEN
jgi:hypothetical protein